MQTLTYWMKIYQQLKWGPEGAQPLTACMEFHRGILYQENDAPLKMSEAYLSLLKSLSPLNLLVT